MKSTIKQTGSKPYDRKLASTSLPVDVRNMNSRAAVDGDKVWTLFVRRGKPFMTPVKERPTFKSVLLGCMPNDGTMLANRPQDVLLPGASLSGSIGSERQTSLNISLPYKTLPLGKQVKAYNQKAFQAVTSATAQRIMESLNRIATPLGDENKIDTRGGQGSDPLHTFVPSSYKRWSLLKSRRSVPKPIQLSTKEPSVHQHPAMVTREITDSYVDRRQHLEPEERKIESARLIISQEPPKFSERKEPLVMCYDQRQDETVGKMKAKRFSQHGSSSVRADNDQLVEVPKLKTGFTLPISSMTPISLQPLPVKCNTTATVSTPEIDRVDPQNFTFSDPLEERRQLTGQALHYPDKAFKFSSPIKASLWKSSAAGAEGGSRSCPEPAVGASSAQLPVNSSAAFTSHVPAWGSVLPKPKLASPDIGASRATSKPSPVITVSSQGTDDLMTKFKKPPGAWECGVCMVVNKYEANKCDACASTKSDYTPSHSLPALGNNSLGPLVTSPLGGFTFSTSSTSSGTLPFGSTPSFSFGSTSQLAGVPFQFAAKPVENSKSEPSLFKFGGTSTISDGTIPPGMKVITGFNFGTNDGGRKKL